VLSVPGRVDDGRDPGRVAGRVPLAGARPAGAAALVGIGGAAVRATGLAAAPGRGAATLTAFAATRSEGAAAGAPSAAALPKFRAHERQRPSAAEGSAQRTPQFEHLEALMFGRDLLTLLASFPSRGKNLARLVDQFVYAHHSLFERVRFVDE
jgi:hypothetical protein